MSNVNNITEFNIINDVLVMLAAQLSKSRENTSSLDMQDASWRDGLESGLERAIDALEEAIAENKVTEKENIEYTAEEIIRWVGSMSRLEWTNLLRKHGHLNHDVGVNDTKVVEMYIYEHKNLK